MSWAWVTDWDSDPLVGNAEIHRVLADELDIRARRYQELAAQLAPLAQPVEGFVGLAAGVLGELTEALRELFRTSAETLFQAGLALHRHADELELLGRDADHSLDDGCRAMAVARRNESQALLVGDAEAAAAAVAASQVARQSARSDHLRLQALELELEVRTRHRLGELSAVLASMLAGTSFALVGDAFAGVESTWEAIAPALRTAGVDLVLPSRDARTVNCFEVVEDGELVVWTGGPEGGRYVAGVDIDPDVFAFTAFLKGGRITEDRPWGQWDDLSDSEKASTQWAYAENMAPGHAAAPYIGGVNGTWDNVREGGEYSPTEIRTFDAVALGGQLQGGTRGKPSARVRGGALGVVVNGAGWGRTNGLDQPGKPNYYTMATGAVLGLSSSLAHPECHVDYYDRTSERRAVETRRSKD